jgi:hypothetical protein
MDIVVVFMYLILVTGQMIRESFLIVAFYKDDF